MEREAMQKLVSEKQKIKEAKTRASDDLKRSIEEVNKRLDDLDRDIDALEDDIGELNENLDGLDMGELHDYCTNFLARVFNPELNIIFRLTDENLFKDYHTLNIYIGTKRVADDMVRIYPPTSLVLSTLEEMISEQLLPELMKY